MDPRSFFQPGRWATRGRWHLPVAVAALCCAMTTEADLPPATPIAPKVMIVNAFDFEAAPWIAALHPTRSYAVPGLSPDGPAVRCTDSGVCQLTTGMGHANAAASLMALVYSGWFDVHHTYFLIAGIAGINPAHGTIGSVAWARYAVDVGLTHEIDPREAPRGWPDGYFGIMTAGPGQKPAFDYRTEAFQLNERLLQAALRLSAPVALADQADVRAYRANYARAPASAAPRVIQCDTASGDTWWSGRRQGEHVSRWTRLLTDGSGEYCTTQQEDNATLNVLTRAVHSGLVDWQRIAIERSGSDFDRPYPGQSVHASMLAQRSIAGAGAIAVDNLVRAGMPLVEAIVTHWDAWADGVPALP